MRTESVDVCDGIRLIDVGMFDTRGVVSTYLVTGETTVLIDTGPSTRSEHLVQGIRDAGITPRTLDFVLLSHLHLDHVGGVNKLAEVCPNATFITNEPVYEKITDSDALSAFLQRARWVLGSKFDAYGSIEPLSKSRLRTVQAGERLTLGEHEFDVIDSPGHTSDHSAFYHVNSGCLYAGDALGLTREQQVHPMSPPPYFDLEQNLDTIDKLRQTDPEKVLFGHYGVREDAEQVFTNYERELTEWVERVDEATSAPEKEQDLLQSGSLPPTERDVLGAKMYLGKASAPDDVPT